jgi:integrase
MKLRYYLKRRGSGPHPIYIALYQGNITELIYTGERIKSNDWSEANREPKNHNSDVTKAIEKVKTAVKKAIAKLELEDRVVTPFSVKLAYMETVAERHQRQALIDERSKKEMVTVCKLADRWVEEELFRFRPSTQRAVKESITAFTAYLKSVGYATLERKALNQTIISGYERYLLEKKKLADSTHGKRIKHLRWFLKWLDFDVSKIKLRSSKKPIISLTLEELKQLESVDVSFSVEFQKAKDMFLLGCYTGLRISDLKRLNVTNTKDGFIKLKLLKNDKDVLIPIIKSADVILSKYNYHSPKISEQAVNECLKTICEKAEIKDKVVIDYTRGGQRLSKTKPKYELITSHIAGKTFITLAPKLWGLSPAEIAAIVGKDVKTLINSYFGDQGDEARQKMITRDNALLSVSN